MTPVDVLKAARAKIEQGWTQGAFALDRERGVVPVNSPAAVCWCSLGAIKFADHDLYSDSYFAAEKILGRASGNANIIPWNDAPGRTQAEVLEVFDHAIALAESEAAHA
jgi:hypothetical protein